MQLLKTDDVASRACHFQSDRFISPQVTNHIVQAHSEWIAKLCGRTKKQPKRPTHNLRCSARNNRRIVPAEAKAVAHHRAEFPLAGRVGRVVQIARRVGRRVIDGRRTDTGLERLHTDYQLHAAAGAQQMPQLTLGAGDTYTAGVVAEHSLYGNRLRLVAERSARTVGVNVIDCVRIEFRIA